MKRAMLLFIKRTMYGSFITIFFIACDISSEIVNNLDCNQE